MLTHTSSKAGERTHTGRKAQKAAQALADRINRVIHTQNLYFIATGERYVNAHAELVLGQWVVLVDALYGQVGQQWNDGAFRNGNGHAVYLS